MNNLAKRMLLQETKPVWPHKYISTTRAATFERTWKRLWHGTHKKRYGVVELYNNQLAL
jgi:hypothetical protein